MDGLAFDVTSNPDFKEVLELALAEIYSEEDPVEAQRKIAAHMSTFFMMGVSVGMQMEKNDLEGIAG